MQTHPITLLSVIVLLTTSVHAQNVQTNNRGVIINVVVPASEQPLNLPPRAEYTAEEAARDTQLRYDKVKFELELADAKRANATPVAAPATPYFYRAVVVENVTLRTSQDVKSVRLSIIPSGTTVSVDKRRGGMSEGWSAVTYYESSSFGGRYVKGFIQSRFLQ